MINKWANYVHEYIYEGLQLNLHILYYVCYNNIWVDPGLNLVRVPNRKYIILPKPYIQFFF